MDEFCHQQPQPQRQNLGTNVYTAIGRLQSDVSTIGKKLDLDPRAQADIVLHQALIHLPWLGSLVIPWIKIHSNPGAK